MPFRMGWSDARIARITRRRQLRLSFAPDQNSSGGIRHLPSVARMEGRKTNPGSRSRKPGTDGTASEFPAKGAGNPWRSRQSTEGQFFMKFRGPKAHPNRVEKPPSGNGGAD